MTTLEETSLDNIEDKAFETLAGLLHSTHLEKIEFNNSSDNDEDDSIDIFVGAPAESDGHIVVSTFGAGSLPTKGNANLDGIEKPYRAEFFSVVKDATEVRSIAERLAKLAFIVNAHQEAFVPGIIIDGLGSEGELTHTLISEQPFGVLHGHGAVPILTSDFAIFWIAVTPISSEEAKLVSSEENGFQKFETFANEQALSFYENARQTYTAEAPTAEEI